MKPQIRRILESHLAKLDTFPTAWEGVKTEPKLPYQAVYLSVNTAKTSTISDKPLATETGFLQLTLFFDNGQGTKAIEQRASQLRQHFYGLSVVESHIQLIIHHPPQIGGLFLSGNSLALPITIPFTAYQLEDNDGKLTRDTAFGGAV